MPAFHRPRLAAVRGALLLALAPLASSALAQASLTTLGVPYTQSFDTLPASGSATWTNNSTVPGWFHARTGTGTTIVANDGSSNAGNLYSYGTGTATDRALGSLGSGNAAVGNLFWGVRLQNNTGATITQDPANALTIGAPDVATTENVVAFRVSGGTAGQRVRIYVLATNGTDSKRDHFDVITKT